MKKALSLILALTLVLAFAAPAFAADQTYTHDQVETMYENIVPFSLPKAIDSCKEPNGPSFADICNQYQAAVMLQVNDKEEYDNIPNYVKELDNLLADGLIPTNVPIFAMVYILVTDPAFGPNGEPDDNWSIFWNNGNQVALPKTAYGNEELDLAIAHGVVVHFEDLPNYENIDHEMLNSISISLETLYEELQLDEYDYVLHPELSQTDTAQSTPLSDNDGSGRDDSTTIVGGFSDVQEDDYFAEAVAWAAEQNITNGVGGGNFGLVGTLSYEQMLTFMCRAAGVDTTGDWSGKAQTWANSNGLTDGISYTAKGGCPRSDTVYFLWKEMN